MSDSGKKPKSEKGLFSGAEARAARNQEWIAKANARFRAKFEATRFGAAYSKGIKKIDAFKWGRFPIGKLLHNATVIAVSLLAMVLIVLGFDAWQLSTYDYQLTQSQKDAGYGVTFNEEGRHSTPDDVASRFFTDQESSTTRACNTKETCWDFKVLPLVKSCLKVHVKMEFFETDNFLAQPVDTREKTFKPESRGVFFAGAEYDLRLGSENPKATYASLNRVYCIN